MDAEPTRIVAIRHGETDWNVDGRLQGHADIPLNAMGRRQAARLADALREEGLSAVYTSDLARAHATAQALAVPLGLPLQAQAALRERGFGMFEGRTREELATQYPDEWLRWQRREADWAPPQAETLTDFSARCLDAADRCARRHPGEAIALVCHGGVLDCLYRAATGQGLDAPRSWRLANASIHRLLYTGQGLTLVGWNDVGHLDGLSLDELG